MYKVTVARREWVRPGASRVSRGNEVVVVGRPGGGEGMVWAFAGRFGTSWAVRSRAAGWGGGRMDGWMDDMSIAGGDPQGPKHKALAAHRPDQLCLERCEGNIPVSAPTATRAPYSRFLGGPPGHQHSGRGGVSRGGGGGRGGEGGIVGCGSTDQHIHR